MNPSDVSAQPKPSDRVLELIHDLLLLQIRHDAGTPLVDELSEGLAELATIEAGGEGLFTACCAWARVITTVAEQTDGGTGDVICETFPVNGSIPDPETAAAAGQVAAIITAVGASDYRDALSVWRSMVPDQACDVALLILAVAAQCAKHLEEMSRG